MPAELHALADDLRAETAALDELLAGAGDDRWSTATPAVGWTVLDQVTHLAFFDDATTTAAPAPAITTEPAVPQVAAKIEGAVDAGVRQTAGKADGLSLREIAARLNEQGHTTRHGRPWNPVQVSRVLERAK